MIRSQERKFIVLHLANESLPDALIDCNPTAQSVRAHTGAGHVFHLILSLKTLHSQTSTTSPLLLQPDVLVARGNAPEARPC